MCLDWNDVLLKSIRNGSLYNVKCCLENGADASMKYDSDGETALMLAKTDKIKIFLKQI